jgi:hypothetical protein
MRLILIVAVLLLMQSHAHAAAIYRWVSDPTGNPTIQGHLEIPDEAFFAGSFYQHNRQFGPTDVVSRTRFSFTGTYSGTVTQCAFCTPPGPTRTFTDQPEHMFISLDEVLFAVIMTFDLRITGDRLEGLMDILTFNDELTLSGSGDAWRITRVGSDHGSIGDLCNPRIGGAANCAHLTGRWELVSAPRRVPEPMSAAIVLIGLAGIVTARRRRK